MMPQATAGMSKDDFDSLIELYGGEMWRALEKYIRLKRLSLNEDVLREWYTCTADKVMETGIRTLALVSRMRELEDLINEMKQIAEDDEEEVEEAEPKKITDYIDDLTS